MKLREIAAISGKPGLYRIIKPTRTGVIIEAIDNTHKRDAAGAQAKVSLLSEITVYTTTAEGSVPLRDLFKVAFEKFPTGNGLSGKSEGADLQDFMAAIAPDFDRTRVYNSDIKKISSWFNILVEIAPEVFGPEEEETATESAEEAVVKETPMPEAEVEAPAKASKPKKAKKAE